MGLVSQRQLGNLEAASLEPVHGHVVAERILAAQEDDETLGGGYP